MPESQPPSSLKFGTSGLRGLVTDLNGAPAYAYSTAFIDTLVDAGSLKAGDRVFLGRDHRASSPAIAALCAQAIADRGLVAVDCGALPTPALALAAMTAQAPSIMVTGSHIPEDRNGLKFYRADGEIDKTDEARIIARHARNGIARVPDGASPPTVAFDALAPYRKRYLDFFAADVFAGLTIGIYQHSSVARDLLVEMLGALGARTVSLGRAEAFIPVDTEAVRDEDKALAAHWAGSHGFDALVSTDGDADRPLIADNTGAYLRGDLVGALTARMLGVTTLVTPVTSNSQIEACGAFTRVLRTRVGSPYVIAGIEDARAQGSVPVLGFEANGGVLLGSDVERDGRVLASLLTRDAMLPILCTLAAIKAEGRPLAAIVADLGFAHADSTRIEHVAQDRSGPFLSLLTDDSGFRERFFADAGGVARLDATDGLRFTLSSGATVHYRASGNAPELRVYVEALSADAVAPLMAWAYAAARAEVAS